MTRKSRSAGLNEVAYRDCACVDVSADALCRSRELGAWIQRHWAIENGLHWRRAVTWLEDKSQVRMGYSPHVMASLRNIAITLLTNLGYTNLAKAT